MSISQPRGNADQPQQPTTGPRPEAASPTAAGSAAPPVAARVRFDREREIYGDESAAIDLVGEGHAGPSSGGATTGAPAEVSRPVLKPRPAPPVQEGRVCPQCNYDMRANPKAQRCPECGANVPLAGATYGRGAREPLAAWSASALARVRWGALLIALGWAGIAVGFPVTRYYTHKFSPFPMRVVLGASLMLVTVGAWRAGMLSSQRLVRNTTPDEVRQHRNRRMVLLVAHGMALTLFLIALMSAQGFQGATEAAAILLAMTITVITATLCHGLRQIATDLEDPQLAERFWNLLWGHAIVGGLSSIIVVQFVTALTLPVLCASLVAIPVLWIGIWFVSIWSTMRISSMAAWGRRYQRDEIARSQRLREKAR